MRYSHLAPEHPQSSLEMLVPSSQLVIGYRQEEAKGRKDLGDDELALFDLLLKDLIN